MPAGPLSGRAGGPGFPIRTRCSSLYTGQAGALVSVLPRNAEWVQGRHAEAVLLNLRLFEFRLFSLGVRLTPRLPVSFRQVEVRTRAQGHLPDGTLQCGNGGGRMIGVQMGTPQIEAAEPAVFGWHGLHGRTQSFDSLLRRALADLNGRNHQQRRPVLRVAELFFLELSQRLS